MELHAGNDLDADALLDLQRGRGKCPRCGRPGPLPQRLLALNDAVFEHDAIRIGDGGAQIHRAIYSEQRNIQKYLDLTARTQLTPVDCEAMATMLQAKRKPNDALAWLERGIQIDKPGAFDSGSGYKLAAMRRALLAKLGRRNEALDSAWVEFQVQPGKFAYQELLRYVPKAERQAWHEKAMAAAAQGDLASLIELWLSVKEIDRLAQRLDRTGMAELEGLGHYVTEPAAERLAKIHPGAAAKLFRALCVRILDAGKSKYY